MRDAGMGEDVRIIHGDSREFLRELQPGAVGCVITDPPYGVDFQGKNTKHTSRQGAGYSSLSDDQEYVRDVVVPIVRECIEKVGRVVVTPGVRNLHLYPPPAEIGCIYCPSGAGLGKWGFVCFHPILYYGQCPYLKSGKGHRPNGFSSTEAAKPNGHPCPKPFGWMKWLVEKASLPGETVLDPFGGSGTTAVACMKAGRRCIIVEQDERYIPIIERRVREAETPLFQGLSVD